MKKSNVVALPKPTWMSRELIENTIRVWSKELGREVTEAEAVEMLYTVRRLAEALRRKDEDGNAAA
jgi:hypothetical protein